MPTTFRARNRGAKTITGRRNRATAEARLAAMKTQAGTSVNITCSNKAVKSKLSRHPLTEGPNVLSLLHAIFHRIEIELYSSFRSNKECQHVVFHSNLGYDEMGRNELPEWVATSSTLRKKCGVKQTPRRDQAVVSVATTFSSGCHHRRWILRNRSKALNPGSYLQNGNYQ